MNRYIIQLAYDGTAYHGWQIQPNGISVQEVLQKGLSTLLQEEIKVVGCGRTDTGVHASYFVAHFDSKTLVDDTDKLCYKLNSFLPQDVVLFDIKASTEKFHARFSAISRSYEYHLVQNKSPFHLLYTHRCTLPLDFEAMNKAAQHLLMAVDFTSFSKLHTDTFTNNCDVKEAVWRQKEDGYWVFHISADRFLRNMVRSIVGTLIDVGKGRLTETDFDKIIEAKDRGEAGVSIPAKGLFLTNVQYPEEFNVRLQ